MGNKNKSRSQEAEKEARENATAAATTTDKPSFLTGGASIDPTLASLFEKSVSLFAVYCYFYYDILLQ